MTSTINDLETWENGTAGRVWVKKFGADGRLKDEIIASGRRINLSPQERRINQEMAAKEDLDVFKNGTLQPVRLIDGAEDAAEFASNPNHLSETDIKALVKGHHKTLDARLKEIRNPAAIQRLLAAAKAEDASISVVERIQKRLTEVAPSLYEEVTPIGADDPRQGGLRAVTPR